MLRPPRRSRASLARSSALVALLALTGCPSRPAGPTATATGGTSSAAALASASTTSAPAAPSALVHAPGTVPTAKPIAPRPDAGAAPAPKLTPLAPAKARGGAEVVGASFTRRGDLVISGAASVALVDPATGAGVSIVPGGDVLELSTDGALAALAGRDAVALWDLRAAALRRTFPGEAAALRFSSDGKRLAIGGTASLRVVDTTDGRELAKPSVDGLVNDLAFGAGDELAVVTNVTAVLVVSATTGAVLRGGGPAETTGTFGLVLSPGARFAAAGAPAGHALQVFDVHAWAPRTLVIVPEGNCREHVSPAFSADGHHVMAFGGQRWVKAFDVPSWKPWASYHAPPGRELATAADDLSRVVVTREEGRGAVVVTTATGAETPLERAFDAAASYSMSADGLHVAGTADGAARVWSAKTGRLEHEQTK